MAYFKTDSARSASTFVTLGILYFCFMMFGVFTEFGLRVRIGDRVGGLRRRTAAVPW
jgi:hypothetical protein